MDEGYIYCFSNISMPNILKIGMTEREPDERLNEANISDTWRPPTPYKIEIAKKVSNPKQKEKTLHLLLSQYSERINPKREFFKISIDEIKIFFDLMDGEIWIEKNYDDEKDYDEKDEKDEKKMNKIHRDMSKCFTDGQRIRHVIGINKIWIAKYDIIKNIIVYENYEFKSLSGFAGKHYSIDKPGRISANGWKECECEINGKWVSTYNLA